MRNIKELENQIFDKMQKIQALLKKIEVLEIQKKNLLNELSNIKEKHNNDLKELNIVIEEIKLLLENSNG